MALGSANDRSKINWHKQSLMFNLLIVMLIVTSICCTLSKKPNLSDLHHDPNLTIKPSWRSISNGPNEDQV
jgi:hypothetical protein